MHRKEAEDAFLGRVRVKIPEKDFIGKIKALGPYDRTNKTDPKHLDPPVTIEDDSGKQIETICSKIEACP